MDKISSARKIAAENLRSLYGEKGIFAGASHFNDYWSWDSFYASLGSLALGDFDIARKNLDLFISGMKNDGQIPLRIGTTTLGIILSYIGFKQAKRFPVYNNDKSLSPPVIQNSLFLIAFHEYILAANDNAYLKKNISKVEDILSWNFAKDRDSDLLIEEDEYCNWADSIKKKGKVLYTNICHSYANKCVSDLYSMLGDMDKKRHYLSLHKKINKKIDDLFWNGKYYIDWIDREKKHEYFSTDGNFLAIFWDIADRKKAVRIVKASYGFTKKGVPGRCVHPPYPDSLVSPALRLIGLGDYHNGVSWIWLGAVCAIAKNRLGMKKEAHDIMEQLASLII
ncbi:MAG: hypothetical protein HGA85_06135, partial [Nanoarchaeota archaeon]|nr:hypothetical protein [Nanoarchaeota archaeon]